MAAPALTWPRGRPPDWRNGVNESAEPHAVEVSAHVSALFFSSVSLTNAMHQTPGASRADKGVWTGRDPNMTGCAWQHKSKASPLRTPHSALRIWRLPVHGRFGGIVAVENPHERQAPPRAGRRGIVFSRLLVPFTLLLMG